MSFEVDLYQYLQGISGLTSLIGDRLFTDIAPTQVLNPPYVTYLKIGGETPHHLDGSTTLVDQRYQFDIYSLTPDGREAIFEALRLALDGYNGTMGSSSVRFFLENEQNVTDEPNDASQKIIYRCIVTFDVWLHRTLADPN